MPGDEISKRMQLLEERYAFQEKIIDDLNEVIIDQQAQLDRLREQLRELRELLAAQQPPYSPFGGDDPPPPHY